MCNLTATSSSQEGQSYLLSVFLCSLWQNQNNIIKYVGVPLLSLLCLMSPQVFLAQGLGAGLAMGMTYIPSLSIVSHYFNRRRPIAMGLVAAGSSLGATLHPIMLNNLFNNPRVGFATGVRASAGLILGLLVIAFSMMRTRLPPKKAVGFLGIWSSATTFSRDWAYVCAVCGCVLVNNITIQRSVLTRCSF